MDSLTPSLSQNSENLLAKPQNGSYLEPAQPKKQLTVADLPVSFPIDFPINPLTLVPQQLATGEQPVEDHVTEFDPGIFQQMIASDRKRAEKMVEDLLAAAEKIRQEHILPMAPKFSHPYYQMLDSFLGPDFVPPKVEDLPHPDKYSPDESLKKLKRIGEKYAEDFKTQIYMMSAEAMDMSYQGITGENVGNAFSILSATEAGTKCVLDLPRLKQHLILAEIFRSTPCEYFIQHPIESAHKLLKFFVDINEDYISDSNIPVHSSEPTAQFFN
jgi:hypothetical protein